MNQTRERERNSSIELLRILAMLFIITSHYSVHGVLSSRSMDFGINQILMQWAVLGNLGVVIFLLITGYFSITSKFKLYKLVKLELQVLTYSWGVLALFAIFSPESITLKTGITSLFPLLFASNWFFTCYIVLYMLIPFINKLLNNLNKKEHTALLALMFLIWTIIPTFTSRSLYLSPLLEFIYYYSIGAYLRKYPMPNKTEKNIAIALTIAGLGLMFLSSVVFDILAVHIHPALIKGSNFFYSRNNLLTLSAAIGLFILFKNWNIGSNKSINRIASLTFGIYLIHDNNLIRPFLWKNILSNAAFANSPFLIIHLLFSVLTVFIVCGMIEFLRQSLLERPLDNKLQSGCEKLTSKSCDWFNKIYGKFNKSSITEVQK